MKTHNLLPLLLLLILACSTQEGQKTYALKETNEKLSFPIDSDTKNNFNTYSIYQDKDGKEYFTFQNYENNTIHFYDLKQQKPAFRITPPQEGSNGVGRTFGYYIRNLDSIYIFSYYKNALYRINKEC